MLLYLLGGVIYTIICAIVEQDTIAEFMDTCPFPRVGIFSCIILLITLYPLWGFLHILNFIILPYFKKGK